MNKTVKYILAFFASMIVAIYLFFAFVLVDTKEAELICSNIKISVENTGQMSLVQKKDVESILKKSGEPIVGLPLNRINLFNVKELLNEHNAIKKAKVYTTIDGALNIDIEQRRPILRVQCDNARFYIDDLGYMFPVLFSSNLYIPIVTGIIKNVPATGFIGAIPQDKSGAFLNKLYEFAVFLQNDKFWNNMIEQIHISGDKIELIPQVANHVVIMGSLDNFKTKLKKLHTFYKNAMPTIGWDKYKTLNIEYKNQIVCKK